MESITLNRGRINVLNKKKVKYLNSILMLASMLFLSMPVFAGSDAMLELLKLLKDKGSISAEEYGLLVNTARADEEKSDEVNHDFKKEITQTVRGLDRARWAEKIRIKGDARMRYQKQTEDGKPNRGRGRVRYRLGFIAHPVNRVEVGAGLASGSSDQRSTNQSFDGSFDTKNIGLDYAYAEFRATDSIKAIAGKFKRKHYLWAPTDLIWDSDINPEGFSAGFDFRNALGDTFVNTGIWVLEEDPNSSNDPYLFYGQLGQKFRTDDFYATAAATYYGFNDISSLAVLTNSEGTNTDFRFDSLGLSAEIGASNIFGSGKSAAVFTDFIKNVDTGSPEDTGYAVGLKFGDKKTAHAGTWQFKYIYARLEANAFPDFLPDSDRFDGLTGIKGHEFIVNYAVMKNVVLGLDFYRSEKIAGNTDQNLLQTDIVIKF